MPDVGKHRLHRGEASAVDPSATFRVDRPLHELDVVQRGTRGLAVEEADLPGLRHFGLSQVSTTSLAVIGNAH